jgi:epoxide hydrolase
LTNVSIFWFTGAGASSAHGTYEGMRAWRAMIAHGSRAADEQREAPSGPPTGYAVFAADTTIRSLADPDGRVTHWSEFDSGGHFPAMEVPDLLVGDLRAFFGPLR